ncbi:BA75_02625T0 [Komagataella pastoris]|uniref:BA75_02625T0 n=1 Tax=Komagataella pastoris TaxID=4922 RepID=A0A1B2JCX8_PICPA|nr:BA75_02625T0 [Komagataella pastoris]
MGQRDGSRRRKKKEPPEKLDLSEVVPTFGYEEFHVEQDENPVDQDELDANVEYLIAGETISTSGKFGNVVASLAVPKSKSKPEKPQNVQLKLSSSNIEEILDDLDLIIFDDDNDNDRHYKVLKKEGFKVEDPLFDKKKLNRKNRRFCRILESDFNVTVKSEKELQQKIKEFDLKNYEPKPIPKETVTTSVALQTNNLLYNKVIYKTDPEQRISYYDLTKMRLNHEHIKEVVQSSTNLNKSIVEWLLINQSTLAKDGDYRIIQTILDYSIRKLENHHLEPSEEYLRTSREMNLTWPLSNCLSMILVWGIHEFLSKKCNYISPVLIDKIKNKSKKMVIMKAFGSGLHLWDLNTRKQQVSPEAWNILEKYRRNYKFEDQTFIIILRLLSFPNSKA